jgi:hypothetical protein
MANLDSRNKRAAGIGLDKPYLRLFPLPDGAIGQQDRQQTAFKYGGILASAPGGGPTAFPWIYYAQQRRRSR